MWLGSDGKLNITATQIKAGKLQAKNGQSYFDLDSGEIVGRNAKMSGRFVSPGNIVSATLGNTEQIINGATPGQTLVFHPASTDPFAGWDYLNSYSALIAMQDELAINVLRGGLSLWCGTGKKITANNYEVYSKKNIQCGYVDVNSNSGSSGNYYGTATVYFSPAFSKIPVPSLTVVTSDATRVAASIDSASEGLTANSMQIRVVRQGGKGTTRVFWTAIEPR